MSGPRIAAVLLAAGSSRRMGGVNKLAALVGGKPLARHAAEAALSGKAHPLVVVTGHAPQVVEEALAGLPVRFVHNEQHAMGMSGSVRAGVASLPEDVEGAIVLLGDMPGVTGETIRGLIAAFRPGRIVVPFHAGQRGNPVLWPRELFPALMNVSGDKGGRAIIDGNRDLVVAVEMGREVVTDLDTPEALAAALGEAGGLPRSV